MTATESEIISRLHDIDTGKVVRDYWQDAQSKIDKLFIRLLCAQWLGIIILSFIVAPLTWIGQTAYVNVHVYASIGIGFLILTAPIAIYFRDPGSVMSRHAIAIAQMMMSALLIHVTGGRIESHFHVFGSLALLSFYRDWKVLMTATVVVAADHLLREILFPISVYGVSQTSGWRWVEHAWWVVFEDLFLIPATIRARTEADSLVAANFKQRTAVRNIQSLVEERTLELVESKEEAERLAFIVKNTDDTVLVLDEQGCISWVNGAFDKRYKISVDEAVGKKYVDLLKQDKMDQQSLSIITHYIDNLVDSMGDLITVREHGEEKSFIAHEFILKSNDSGIQGLVVIESDQTEIMLAQERARLAYEEAEVLMDSFNGSVVGVGPDWKIFKWNKVASEWFGVKKAQVIGKDIRTLEHKYAGETLTAFMEQVKSGETEKKTLEVKSKDSDDVVLFNANLIESSKNEGGFIMMGINVTDRKSLEKQLYHAQKMESVGQLAAGVAHEINTPIQFIGDNLRFFKDSFQDLVKMVNDCNIKITESSKELKGELDTLMEEADFEYLVEEVPEAIDQSIEGVGRVAKIVRAMKDFSHPGDNEKEPSDINNCINGAATMAKNEYKYCADLELELDDALPMVECNKNEITQVVLVMIVNAAHAIQEALEQSGDERGLIQVKSEMSGDEEVLIKVKDSGTGMPPEVREKIFNAFFTTKEVGKGTGQGLSLAHTIIAQNHGGVIEVESEVGAGTEFTIRLPVKAAVASELEHA